jgi:hypothetical protein
MIFSYGQEEEADTEDDDEYVPPTLIMDTELDYGEIEPEASIVRIRMRITECGKLANLSLILEKLCLISSGSRTFSKWDPERIAPDPQHYGTYP